MSSDTVAMRIAFSHSLYDDVSTLYQMTGCSGKYLEERDLDIITVLPRNLQGGLNKEQMSFFLRSYDRAS